MADMEVPILVYVVLDAMSREQLAPDSTASNRHSFRSLWDREVDYWDIQTNHTTCSVRCKFDIREESRDLANGILFSAQLFPAFSLFFDVMTKANTLIPLSLRFKVLKAYVYLHSGFHHRQQSYGRLRLSRIFALEHRSRCWKIWLT